MRREKEERRREEEDRRQKHDLKLLQEKRLIDLDRDRKRATKDVPQLPLLKDGWDIENFLRTFQDQMRMHGIEKAYWSTNLLAVLDHKSLTFQSGLDLADKQDFNVLSAKLVTFHGVMPNFYRTQWNEIKLMTGESFQQCLQQTQIISQLDKTSKNQRGRHKHDKPWETAGRHGPIHQNVGKTAKSHNSKHRCRAGWQVHTITGHTRGSTEVDKIGTSQNLAKLTTQSLQRELCLQPQCQQPLTQISHRGLQPLMR